jgi:hypothetical protein
MEKKDDSKPGQHRATYSRDKIKGGYIINVTGPQANRFAGRTVPITLKNGDKSEEKLTDLIWSGTNDDGKYCAIYHFEPKPKDELNDEIPF